MRLHVQWVAFAIVVATIVALAPAKLHAQKKKANTAQPNASQVQDATENDYAWASYNKGLAEGTIMAFNGGSSVTVRVTYYNLEPNPKYKPPVLKKNTRGYNAQSANHHHNYQSYRNFHQQYHNHRPGAGQSPQQAMQAQMRLYQQMMQMQMQLMQSAQRMNTANSNPNNQPFKQVAHSKDFTLDLQDKVVYRKKDLPLEFDDQGNIKKYTVAQKTALQGSDKAKPGYSATADDVQVGATADIYLTATKKKAAADDSVGSNHPTVNMIYLTKEAAPDSSPSQPAAKKKKKN